MKALFRSLLLLSALLPAAAPAGETRTASSSITWAYDIMVQHNHIAPMMFEFEITEPTVITAAGHMVIKHRKNYPCGIGWGLYLGVRGPFSTIQALRDSAPGYTPPTRPAWMPGGIVSGNLEQEEHYKPIPLSGAMELTSTGFYRAEVWASLHGSSACPTVPIAPTDSFASVLVESSGPQNQITYQLIPGALTPRWLQ